MTLLAAAMARAMTCPCPSCALRASWTPEQRAAFDRDDAMDEALEMFATIEPRPIRAEFLGGLRFGRLTVTRPVTTRPKDRSWEARCDCGAIVVAGEGRLRAGRATSCVTCANRATARARSLRSQGLDMFDISRRSGIGIATIKNRIKLGWPPERLGDPLKRAPTFGNRKRVVETRRAA